jgi:excisionase family DNA binding protein
MSEDQSRDAYSVEQARQRLGGIARQTVYNLINAGELDSILIGTRRLIPAHAIAEFVRRRSAQAASGRRSG